MVLVGYVTAKDMDGLTKYYKSLFDDCNNINNLAAINPETINNPSIYAILADKYNKAISKNIQLELGVFIDLNSLHIDTYELTRILGILLDNSIEAAQECDKKYISVRFLMDYRMNRQLVIVENSYKIKDIDTFKIFEKAYTTGWSWGWTAAPSSTSSRRAGTPPTSAAKRPTKTRALTTSA